MSKCHKWKMPIYTVSCSTFSGCIISTRLCRWKHCLFGTLNNLWSCQCAENCFPFWIDEKYTPRYEWPTSMCLSARHWTSDCCSEAAQWAVDDVDDLVSSQVWVETVKLGVKRNDARKRDGCSVDSHITLAAKTHPHTHTHVRNTMSYVLDKMKDCRKTPYRFLPPLKILERITISITWDCLSSALWLLQLCRRPWDQSHCKCSKSRPILHLWSLIFVPQYVHDNDSGKMLHVIWMALNVIGSQGSPSSETQLCVLQSSQMTVNDYEK